MLVIDASLVVAALIDTGPAGSWAEEMLVSDVLAAPHLLQVEVANILRPAVRGRHVPVEVAALAHGAPLATLDGKLARVSGPRCGFRLPRNYRPRS